MIDTKVLLSSNSLQIQLGQWHWSLWNTSETGSLLLLVSMEEHVIRKVDLGKKKSALMIVSFCPVYDPEKQQMSTLDLQVHRSAVAKLGGDDDWLRLF